MSSAVPHHIAIVMDGNGRWATRRFLPRGRPQGRGRSLRRCVRACAARGVAILTVFAFSSENWNRPKEEVSGLMELLVMALVARGAAAGADGVCLHFLGERAGCRRSARRPGAGRGRHGRQFRLFLNVCFNYGGRWDIVQAANRLAQRGARSPRKAWARKCRWASCPSLT
jgi:undecaprenyl diphosphate synthase